MTNEDTIRALEAVKALTGPPISFDRAVSPHLSYAMAKIHSMASMALQIEALPKVGDAKAPR